MSKTRLKDDSTDFRLRANAGVEPMKSLPAIRRKRIARRPRDRSTSDHIYLWPMMIVVLGAQVARAGTIHGSSNWVRDTVVLGEVTTGQPNNDAYSGGFEDNENRLYVNSRTDDGITISGFERAIPVMASGGITEYSVRIAGAWSEERDPPLEEGYLLQLGFGTGDRFVPAQHIAPSLDFDMPTPSSRASR